MRRLESHALVATIIAAANFPSRMPDFNDAVACSQPNPSKAHAEGIGSTTDQSSEWTLRVHEGTQITAQKPSRSAGAGRELSLRSAPCNRIRVVSCSVTQYLVCLGGEPD
jgi:hypothetical protein